MAEIKLSELNALSATPADADEFLINDGGVSKRITYGTIKAGFAPAAKGVTNGDSHNHEGGDGAQIAYANLSGLPTLGTAAATDATAYATAAQGGVADSAVQPGDDAADLGSGAAADGYVLTADGAGGAAWEAVVGGVTDHGALSGLSDDDHSQYHNDARGDARYSLLAHNHAATYAPIANGVTNGNSHDHSGGDGAQIAYSGLSGLPTLGTAAPLNVGTAANNVVQLDGSSRLPAVDGSLLTNLPVGATNLDGLTDVVITTPTNDQVLKYNGTTWVNGSTAGGGDALTSGTLAQFAATTSDQLRGVISNETGTGELVFATSPTLVTPILGTPTSGTLTNCTGLPATGVTGLGTAAAAATTDFAPAPLSTPLLLTNGSGITLSGGVLTVNCAGAADVVSRVTLSATVTSIVLQNVPERCGIYWEFRQSGGPHEMLQAAWPSGTVFDSQYNVFTDSTVTRFWWVTTNGGTDAICECNSPLTTVDDTPVDGATTSPVSSNWAFDHAALTTAHGITTAAATVLDDTTVAAMVDTLGGATSTGTGGLVRATSPTLVTPVLGTPTSGTLTNCTGLPTAGLVDNAVSNAKLANMAASTFKGRVTASTGDPEDMTAAQARSLIEAAVPSVVTITTNTTLTAAAHQGKMLYCTTGALNLTVDNSTDFDAYASCEIVNKTGAVVTFVATATINRIGSKPLTLPANGRATLMREATADVYLLTGEMA